MSMRVLLLQWLNGRLTPKGETRRRPLSGDGDGNGSHSQSLTPEPLRWRTPWVAWQLLSWVTVTLLAPPFSVIGALLIVNSHSDSPLFWPSTMVIIAFTNAVAIVCANQRHHRRPFTRRTRLALLYCGISLLTGCALFFLVLWSTGILGVLAEPLSSFGIDGPWGAAAFLTAVFGVLSFGHASVLHAWLAFDDPEPD